MSLFEFDLSGFPSTSENFSSVEHELNFNDSDFTNNFEELLHSLTSVEDSVVYSKYENLLQLLPQHFEPPTLSDTLLKVCCANYCCYKFSPDSIMRCRLVFPINHDYGDHSSRSKHSKTGDTPFNSIMKTHFLLMKLCFIDNSVAPKICNINVCPEFFRRVYSIPERRYHRLLGQLLLQFEQPTPHGNFGQRRESIVVLQRVARLVNSVASLAEIRPDGKGYQFPSSMTKKDVVDFGIPLQPKKLNPHNELARLCGHFHFHKKNDMTKCCTCLKFKAGINSKRFKPEKIPEAKMHYSNHILNFNIDKRCYWTRMDFSRETDELLSIAHDGFSKEATKFPHLHDERIKSLTDATKMMCSLNLAVVHKKFKNNLSSVGSDSSQNHQNSVDPIAPNKDHKDQLHAFWNVGQLHGSDSNVLISQIYFTISKCSNIPREISIQLDNCASNKSYNVLGAFGMLLLWVPEITKIYICYPEVGHTHDDVDRYFSCLARPLKRKPVYSPFGFQRFVDKYLDGVVTNTLTPPVYDFDSVVGSNVVHNKHLKQNHYFELSKNADGEAVVRIARFIRSEMFLQATPSNGPIFKLFKQKPNLEILPVAVKRSEFNIDQFGRLTKAIEHAIPLEEYEELLTVPYFIQNYPETEPFDNLLDLCRSKVLQTSTSFQHNPDPDNVAINAFLNDPTVWKPWRAPPAVDIITTDSIEANITLPEPTSNSTIALNSVEIEVVPPASSNETELSMETNSQIAVEPVDKEEIPIPSSNETEIMETQSITTESAPEATTNRILRTSSRIASQRKRTATQSDGKGKRKK